MDIFAILQSKKNKEAYQLLLLLEKQSEESAELYRGLSWSFGERERLCEGPGLSPRLRPGEVGHGEQTRHASGPPAHNA